MSEDELAIFRRRNLGIVYQFYNLIPTPVSYTHLDVYKRQDYGYDLEFEDDDVDGSVDEDDNEPV